MRARLALSDGGTARARAPQVLTQIDFGTRADNELASDLAAALLWLANLAWLWKRIARPIGGMLSPERTLAIERGYMCQNTAFVFHRNNECALRT